MANQSGRPIAPARKLMAAVLGTIAVFVMLFGLGLSSWSIVALGVALLALSIALAMVNVVRRGARAWVAGTVQVKAVSQPPASSVYGRAELSVVVIAPGLPIQEVTIRDPRVPVEKWPRPGDTLPVSVDVDDMRRVRINWDEAPTRADSPDLNPPPPAYDLSDDEDLREDDDLLGDPEPPPWATRDRQWGLGPDEPPPPPPPAPRVGDDMDEAAAEGPVVVHDTPAGPILEGELVGHDDRPGPLPQRARSAPGQARPSGSRPSPHPRAGAATATVDPETEGRWSENRSSTPEDPAEAQPTPPQAAAAPPPTQRHPEAPVVGAESPPPVSEPDPEAPAQTQPPAYAEPQPVRPYTEPQPEPNAATVPTPDRPPAAPTPAPAGPGTATAPSNSVSRDHDLEIDLALDGDPEPAPETTAAAHAAVASDIIAPPADSTPAADPEAPMRSAPVEESVAPPGGFPVPAQSSPAENHTAEDAAAPDDSTEVNAASAGAPSFIPAPSTPADGAAATDKAPIEDDDAEQSTTAFSAAHSQPMAAESAPTGSASVDDVAEEDTAARGDLPDDDTAHGAADETAAGATAGAGAAGAADANARAADANTGADADAAGAAGAGAGAGAAGAGAAGAGAADAGAADAGAADAGAPAAGAGAADAGAADAGAADAGAADAGAGRERRPWADLEGGFEPDERADDLITAYPSARPGPAGAIHGVGITVLVTNLERSVEFYRDVLGFFEIDSGATSAVLASGDTRLVLRTVHDLSAEAGRLIYLNLEVGDVEAVYEELKSKGVSFVHGPRPVNRGDKLELWAASFSDPDKHNIAITQWRAIR